MAIDSRSVYARVRELIDARRAHLARQVGRISLMVLTVFTAVELVIAFLLPEFPWQSALISSAVLYGVVLVSIWLRQRGYLGWSAAVYLGGIAGALLGISSLYGGITVSIAVAFVAVTLVAGLVSGRIGAVWTGVLSSLSLLAFSVLEAYGIILPEPIAPLILSVVNAAALVVVIALVVGLLNALLKANEEGLTLAEQRSRELEVSNREVQEVIAAERSARDQQRLESQQLQESVSEYLTFLDKVSAGDYAAKLDLDMIAAQVQNPDIVRLGEALNATVDTLVEVLAEFQVLQQRYLREGWNMFLESESVERVYRVVDEEARTGDVSQFEPLDAALDARKLVVRREDAAIPIEFGGEILGVLGLRRHEGHWTAEDVALIETITDQLAQTMETLRLIDTTQRQVQREQTLSDLSERFARAFDVDLLLQSAVRDLRQILQVDEVSVYVGPSGSAEPVDAGSAVKAPGGDVV